MFIVFEGSEGMGKTTQLRHCATYLRELGYTVVETAESDFGETSLSFQQALVSKATKPGSPMTAFLLSLAARTHHIDTVIRPALQQGHIVLCERFVESAYVQHVVIDGVDSLTFDAMHNHLNTDDVIPDVRLVLDCPREQIPRRNQDDSVGQCDESKAHELEAIDEFFHLLPIDEPHRYCRIDASRDKSSVFGQVKEIVDRLVFGQTPSSRDHNDPINEDLEKTISRFAYALKDPRTLLEAVMALMVRAGELEAIGEFNFVDRTVSTLALDDSSAPQSFRANQPTNVSVSNFLEQCVDRHNQRYENKIDEQTMARIYLDRFLHQLALQQPTRNDPDQPESKLEEKMTH